MPLPNPGLAPEKVQAAGTDTSEAADVRRKQRKRLQNRLNQRAHRDRTRDLHATGSRRQSRPFQTDRWRLDEIDSRPSNALTPGQRLERAYDGQANDLSGVNRSGSGFLIPLSDRILSTATVELYGQKLWVVSSPVGASSSPTSALSPNADHLLRLLNYNAFRGFFYNKSLLSRLTKHLSQSSGQTQVVDIMQRFPGQTTILPAAPNIPCYLVPTRLQMEKPHATWIDLLPFPRIRDNLIRHHDRFDHWMFMRDVIGNLVDELMFLKPKGGPKPRGYLQVVQTEGIDEGLTTNRKGLILWGEPHDPENWEATPEFLRNWGWAVEGCRELVEYSNRWRSVRDEEPIKLSDGMHVPA
ncbi:hypothetical protein AK830_g1287 [Neonectria ditissima]|uniref:BZIP domain-containing protein n=1 Tax=Neonectria ditissima TaxID=78410 RepID=A0A0P7BV26_9HYPO|nr:hypothetical protein AK830_g1287 [Neonectria ditissima]